MFKAHIQPDIVNCAHIHLHKISRQSYAVSDLPGPQSAAEPRGTGRAVAPIPRIRGGGAHCSGQGDWGNMCFGDQMFTPNKT